MKKTHLTRALFVAGVMAAAGGLAQADAIFYPDGTHVELGANAVENGLADAVLARSSTTAPSRGELLAMGVTADQSGPMLASNDIDTTSLGAGPAMTSTTVTTTRPVYVFPNINFDEHSVLASPHPMMSHARSEVMDRTAAATFDSPTRAGEASTMTAGAPNLLTDNPSTPSSSYAALPAPVVDGSTNTTTLGAGPASMGSSTWYGTPSYELNSNVNNSGTHTNCGLGGNHPCGYLPN